MQTFRLVQSTEYFQVKKVVTTFKRKMLILFISSIIIAMHSCTGNQSVRPI